MHPYHPSLPSGLQSCLHVGLLLVISCWTAKTDKTMWKGPVGECHLLINNKAGKQLFFYYQNVYVCDFEWNELVQNVMRQIFRFKFSLIPDLPFVNFPL